MKYKGTWLNFLSYIIIIVSLFVIFCSLNKSSFGTECAVLSCILIITNLTNKNIWEWFPFAIMGTVAILLLILSGQASVRGFNAPIAHALKFIYLMFTVALSIGIKRLSEPHKKKAITAVLVSMFISTCISLYNVIFVDKYAIRYYEARGFSAVLDFSQFYAFCIFLCVLFLAIISFREKTAIWRQVVLALLLLLCIGLSLYATGVLLSALGIVLAFIIYKLDKNKSRTVLWLMIIMILIMLVYVFREQVSNWIYNMTESFNWILRDRLRSVVDTILRTDHNLAYSYERRDELAGYSINTFLKYPLFGVGYREYGYGVIGCHQEWQDMLGVFGIFGTLVFVILMFFLSKKTIETCETKLDKQCFGLAIFLFFILGFLNPCLSLPVLSVVFIVAPNISVVFKK